MNIGNNVGGLTQVVSNNNILSTGSWIHVACVFDDSANNVTFYAVGAEEGIVAMADAPVASGVDATIGDRDDNTRQFDGRLDEAAFFDRTLSGAEVLDIKNNGLGAEAAAANNSQVIIITQG